MYKHVIYRHVHTGTYAYVGMDRESQLDISFLATIRMHHLRDILRRYRLADVLGRSYLPSPLFPPFSWTPPADLNPALVSAQTFASPSPSARRKSSEARRRDVI